MARPQCSQRGDGRDSAPVAPRATPLLVSLRLSGLCLLLKPPKGVSGKRPPVGPETPFKHTPFPDLSRSLPGSIPSPTLPGRPTPKPGPSLGLLDKGPALAPNTFPSPGPLGSLVKLKAFKCPQPASSLFGTSVGPEPSRRLRRL